MQKSASDIKTVKNENGIVVGKWIDDGFRWTVSHNTTVPVRACVYVQAPKQDDEEVKYAYFDVVLANADYSKFTPRGLNIPVSPNGEICFNLTVDSAPVFPVACVLVCSL